MFRRPEERPTMSGEQKTRQRRRDTGRSNATGGAHRNWIVVGSGVGLAVVALLVAVFLFQDAGTSNDRSSQDLAGAPDVELEGFNGNAVKISNLRGQPAVVNFWASWCIPCLAELPGFEGVYQTHGESVQFLGINLADDVASAQNVVEDTGITYPLARDPEGEAFTAFGALGMPTTVFLDAEGRIVELYTGELTAGELEARIIDYFGS